MENKYYKENWDKYYAAMRSKEEEIPWDVSPELAVERDWARMKRFMPEDLILMDIGCGTGRQTHCLHQFAQRVMGTDVSPLGVEMAREKWSHLGIPFEVLDVLDEEQIDSFQRRWGACNLYMRGILQQILPQDRKAFRRGIAGLLGKEGVLYLIELSTEAPSFFMNLHREMGGLPPPLKRVIQEKVTQMVGVNQEVLQEVFPADEFVILESGADTIALKTVENQWVGVPAVYAMVKCIEKVVDL
jgi:SAM-dependent methyltransferase